MTFDCKTLYFIPLLLVLGLGGCKKGASEDDEPRIGFYIDGQLSVSGEKNGTPVRASVAMNAGPPPVTIGKSGLKNSGQFEIKLAENINVNCLKNIRDMFTGTDITVSNDETKWTSFALVTLYDEATHNMQQTDANRLNAYQAGRTYIKYVFVDSPASIKGQVSGNGITSEYDLDFTEEGWHILRLKMSDDAKTLHYSVNTGNISGYKWIPTTEMLPSDHPSL